MRLVRLRLTNFRGVDHAELAFPETGVTIVEGDNEVGKSSLADALDMLLEDPDSSRKERIGSAQPVGKDVGPEVEAEIATGPYRLVFAKRWHRRPETTLRVEAPRREQLTGREAHDRMREILSETLDEDLWQTLRWEQGTDVSRGSGGGFASVPSLGRALDRVGGTEQTGRAEDDLWQRIGAERDRYVTPRGRPSKDRTERQAALEGALRSVTELEAELARMDGDAARVARLTSDLAETEQALAESSRDLTDLEGQTAHIGDLRAAAERAQAHREAARAARDRAAERVDERSRARTDVETTRAALEEYRARVDRADPQRRAAEKRRDEARLAAEEAAEALRRADAAQRRAASDERHRHRELELAQMTERHERIEAARAARRQAEADTERFTVTDAAFTSFTEADRERHTAEALARTTAARLSVEALADITLRVDGADDILGPGEVRDIPLERARVLEFPGVARVSGDPGEGEALERRRAAEEAWTELCRSHGVDSLAAAQESRDRRRRAERLLADTAAAIEQDLRDLSASGLEERIASLEANIAEYAARRGDQPPLPPTLDAATEVLKAAEAELDAARAAEEGARATLEATERDLRAAREDNAERTADMARAEGAAQNAIRRLTEERAGATDEELTTARDAAVSAFGDAAAAADAAAEALAAADPGSVEARRSNAAAAVERLTEDRDRKRTEREDLRIRLEERGERGLAHDLDTARSAFAHLSEEHRRVERRAEAAICLYEAFAARREEARRRHVGPLQRQIEELGRLVYGPGFTVELDDNLAIATRTLGGTTLSLDQLSVGTREQLGILARLACAMLVSDEDGAPVILDDALGWTDPERLRAMGAAIGLAGRHAQVIVLTCVPGRYSAVGDASVVRLA